VKRRYVARLQYHQRTKPHTSTVLLLQQAQGILPVFDTDFSQIFVNCYFCHKCQIYTIVYQFPFTAIIITINRPYLSLTDFLLSITFQLEEITYCG